MRRGTVSFGWRKSEIRGDEGRAHSGTTCVVSRWHMKKGGDFGVANLPAQFVIRFPCLV